MANEQSIYYKVFVAEQKKERLRISHLWKKYILDNLMWFDNVIPTDTRPFMILLPSNKAAGGWAWATHHLKSKNVSAHL